jgi:DNA damage-binding protein 1
LNLYIDVIPRSILIEQLESIPYLFVSLGDGSVISYIISKPSSEYSTSQNGQKRSYELTERRKVVLGTQPTILKKFHSTKPVLSNNIFACSDRPSVISSTNQKLVYSSVNLKQVEYMCQLNSKLYPNSLALMSGGILRIGKMDSIQKLHIRSVPLNETVRRISYQAETQTFGCITFRMDIVGQNGDTKPFQPCASSQCSNLYYSKPNQLVQANSQDSAGPTTSKSSNDFSQFNTQVIHSFLLLDQNTFEVLHSVQFQPSEFATSIISMNFDNDPSNNYFVVGCCYVNDDDPEPKLGRLILFKFNESKLAHVCEKEIKGAPYCLQNYNGKLLCSVSNQIKLFDFRDNQLSQIASYSDNVFITHLKSKNDFILIGDMMKSCAVLTYRVDSNTFEMVAKDYTPVWLSSLDMVDDDNFIMSDCFQNVITLKKDR